MKPCCRALTVECMSCMANQTPYEFCQNPANYNICKGDINYEASLEEQQPSRRHNFLHYLRRSSSNC